MKVPFLDEIDWQRPWLSVVSHAARPILASSDLRVELNVAASSINLRNHRDLPIHFVAQSDLPEGVAYETFISETGKVPTRDNLHDFFNALVWLTFPRIKVQLNALQAAAISKSLQTSQTIGAHRGKLRDGATIFDENAALLVTSDATLIKSLQEHHWQEAFLARRDAFGTTAEVYLFGHALMEKLVSPYKAITAHTWMVEVEPTFFTLMAETKLAWIDATVAQQLVNGLATSDFSHLPVLGVPNWWVLQDRAFYDDASVFRAKRQFKSHKSTD